MSYRWFTTERQPELGCRPKLELAISRGDDDRYQRVPNTERRLRFELRKELLASENANSVIYLAWEHAYLNQFAKRRLKAYGKDPSLVPDWPNDEYDRIYVFRIKDVDGRKDLTFSVEQQGLTDSLRDKCPGQ
jgi:hypothetical protein